MLRVSVRHKGLCGRGLEIAAHGFADSVCEGGLAVEPGAVEKKERFLVHVSGQAVAVEQRSMVSRTIRQVWRPVQSIRAHQVRDLCGPITRHHEP